MLVLMWPGWALIVTRLVLVVSMACCVDLLVCFDSFYIVWSIWIILTCCHVLIETNHVFRQRQQGLDTFLHVSWRQKGVGIQFR